MMILAIPSDLGQEKLILKEMNRFLQASAFLEEDCLDAKTAVAEACLNAIEHGNQLNASLTVGIHLHLENGLLRVYITDHGTGIQSCSREPKEDERGWGIHLISSLVDRWTSYYDKGLHRHIVYLEKKLRMQSEES